MKFEKFETGNHHSIGVELELRILDKFDLTPRNEFEYIVSNINKKFSQNLQKEFLDSMIEINSPIFNNEKDLISYLQEIVENISTIVSKKNLCIQTSGAFAQKNEKFRLTNNPRYKKIHDEHKVLLDDFSICGTHVHIGFENFEKALKAYNYSIYFLPLFVALSASSQFYNGIDTGIHSFRTKIFERLPKASVPEYFESYEKMKNLYELLHKSEVISSTKDIWWDVRVQPHFKTIEFRVCDAINDFERLEVIIGLFKVICQLSEFEEVTKMPMQVLKQNMWSATRYSMDGKMILENGELMPIKEMLNDVLNKALKYEIITKEFFEKAKKCIKKDSIVKQMQRVFKATNSMKEVDRLGVFE